ncbi:hypothetical protein M758_6G076200, partial [Ceratodon purpureus]
TFESYSLSSLGSSISETLPFRIVREDVKLIFTRLTSATQAFLRGEKFLRKRSSSEQAETPRLPRSNGIKSKGNAEAIKHNNGNA